MNWLTSPSLTDTVVQNFDIVNRLVAERIKNASEEFKRISKSGATAGASATALPGKSGSSADMTQKRKSTVPVFSDQQFGHLTRVDRTGESHHHDFSFV